MQNNTKRIETMVNICGYRLRNMNRKANNPHLLEIIKHINEIENLFTKYEESKFYENPLTKTHYANLNNYKEIAPFQPWEINEAIYWHFLEMLPPLKYTATGFLMSEFTYKSVTTHFYKIGESYYCEFYDTKQKAV